MKEIELAKCNWKFNESVANVFDEHVKQSVPMYDEIHSLITDIAGWYLQDNTNVYDIGTSTGKVLISLQNQYEKSVTYIGIDNSISMMEKLKSKKLDFELLNLDVTDNFKFTNASLITSVLTIQFIAENKRQMLIDEVYKGLNKGSAFIMVEKVLSSNVRFNEMYMELYHELKLKNGLSYEHVFNKTRAIRGVMKPYTVDENIELLKNAGFEDIDTFFKWNNFVGFIAVK